MQKENSLYTIRPILITLITLIGLSGCSTQKNTAQSRWWHALNARYNTYYNGTLAYIDGSLEKEQNNQDNYTELIPLYTVGNKNSREIGKANYDRAIEKAEKAIHQHSIKRRPQWTKERRKTAQDIEWLNRREYNPFLWRAWMLLGRSQFFKGDFESAAATFSYMSRLYRTQPAIYGKARAWLVKCYTQQGWLYDAEDVVRNMQRDSIDWRAQKDWDYAYADYYIHQGDYLHAITYLLRVINHEMRRKQKAREWYLLGQLYASLSMQPSQQANNYRLLAYKAFRHVVRLTPPYELEFNARISMTEVMATGNAKKMIAKLKRMATNPKNKEYQDQVFYAIGNIYLAQKDTLAAISAYEQGNHKATRTGIEKGVLLLHLGDLYWQKELFSDAKRCYGEAIGLLDTDRKDYPQMAERSKVLDQLVPYTEAIHLQDSLQALAQMDEKKRNEAIDRIIYALKRKEKEEKNQQAEEDAKSQQVDNSYNNTVANNNRMANLSTNSSQQNIWYFYNPQIVNQGKSQFQKLWGKRENIDNWQRNNKTIVPSREEEQEIPADTIPNLQDSNINATSENTPDTYEAKNDPHKREFYLEQIPFTEEQLAKSNQILEDGLYQAGVIFKDQLNNLKLSEKMLCRLVNNYPNYEHLDDAYYHLYLLYARKNEMKTANLYLEKLKTSFPQSHWTAVLSDPYFIENAKYGVQIEDSLYTASYNAFKKEQYEEVLKNAKVSVERFPEGANRDKFLFIGGLSKLNHEDIKGCIDDMKDIINHYPNSRISEMAGMIVNGVNQGKRLYGGKFNLEDIWNQRSIMLNDSDSIKNIEFSNEHDTSFVYMLVYQPDSVKENQLLFEMAKYNFTTYLVRDFDIQIDKTAPLHRMLITGFRNYEEANLYAHAIAQQTAIKELTSKARSFVISAANLELIGSRFSYNDYGIFYKKHFAANKDIQEKDTLLLTEPEEIITKEISPTDDTEERDEENPSQIIISPNGNSKKEDTGIYFEDGFGKEDNTDEYIELNGF